MAQRRFRSAVLIDLDDPRPPTRRSWGRLPTEVLLALLPIALMVIVLASGPRPAVTLPWAQATPSAAPAVTVSASPAPVTSGLSVPVTPVPSWPGPCLIEPARPPFYSSMPRCLVAMDARGGDEYRRYLSQDGTILEMFIVSDAAYLPATFSGVLAAPRSSGAPGIDSVAGPSGPVMVALLQVDTRWVGVQSQIAPSPWTSPFLFLLAMMPPTPWPANLTIAPDLMP